MKHQRFTFRSLCIIATALSLTACQTIESLKNDILSIELPSLDNATARSANAIVYDGQCPRVEAVEELNTLSQFTTAQTHSPDNLISKIKIQDLQSTCAFDENTVTIDVTMNFAAMLGPHGVKGETNMFSYPFFVAVTKSSGAILAKELFTAPIKFKPGTTAQAYSEKMRQIIPLEHRDKGYNYKILVGFQLTPDQLSYNRWSIAENERKIEAERLRLKEEARQKAEEEKRRLELEQELEREKAMIAKQAINDKEKEKEKRDKLLNGVEKQKSSFWTKKTKEVQEQENKQIFIGRPVDIQ